PHFSYSLSKIEYMTLVTSNPTRRSTIFDMSSGRRCKVPCTDSCWEHSLRCRDPRNCGDMMRGTLEQIFTWESRKKKKKRKKKNHHMRTYGGMSSLKIDSS